MSYYVDFGVSQHFLNLQKHLTRLETPRKYWSYKEKHDPFNASSKGNLSCENRVSIGYIEKYHQNENCNFEYF